jgi:predicted transposase YbfD/YdcC
MEAASTEASAILTLGEHFASLEDPRVERTKLHPLLSIVTIALCAVICGAETWEDIAEFGRAKAEWLGSFLELPNGIPSHDTFNRVFQALDPKQFEACFLNWTKSVAGVLKGVIALDGKTLRGSRGVSSDKEAKQAIHMVSAWASTNRLVLAQVKVDAKSNEITAIPELLRGLAIEGCIVTIDAMGTQREIAKQILDQGADYVLALKENQATLYQEVVEMFDHAKAGTIEELVVEDVRTIEKGHGRIDVRRYRVIPDLDVLEWLQEGSEGHNWPGLKAIGMVEAERRIGDKRTSETRYYLLSAPFSAKAFGEAVRSHWGIENSVHWVLDLGFHEDQSRIRAGNAAENFAVLRHLALNLLQHQTEPKNRRLSVKGRRLKAGWDNAYLLQILRSL